LGRPHGNRNVVVVAKVVIVYIIIIIIIIIIILEVYVHAADTTFTAVGTVVAIVFH